MESQLKEQIKQVYRAIKIILLAWVLMIAFIFFLFALMEIYIYMNELNNNQNFYYE